MKRTPDTVLAALANEPFRVSRPQEQTVPFVFASPHAGRNYPSTFLAASRLSHLTLRRSEDAYVDELFAGVPELGIPLICAQFPRVYVDANRAATELDETMFEAMPSVEIGLPTPRVTAGLGVVPRVVRDGAEIYREKLAPGEAAERLSRFYRPYHTALAGLVQATLARFGTAVVVDCHSMPSGAAVPDVVLGDRYGASAGSGLVRRAELAFEDGGFATARNMPYAGGYTTVLYGRREQGIHAIQIELNRGLYLDEDRVQHASGFERMRVRLMESVKQLTSIDAASLRPHRPLAAE
jgi:N-formylglutamate amidohydrolase